MRDRTVHGEAEARRDRYHPRNAPRLPAGGARFLRGACIRGSINVSNFGRTHGRLRVNDLCNEERLSSPFHFRAATALEARGPTWGPHTKRNFKYGKELCLLRGRRREGTSRGTFKPPPQSNGSAVAYFSFGSEGKPERPAEKSTYLSRD
jgi:hypothetical protein